MAKGILTVQSAGNGGNNPASITSVAPWIFTVAASSIDRRIITKVVLGNGNTLIGESVNSFILEGDKYPFSYGKGPTDVCSEEDLKICRSGCIDKRFMKGKILVCDVTAPYKEVLENGVLGVLDVPIFKNVSLVSPLPSASLNETEFAALKSYLKSTNTPEGKILKSEAANDTSAPIVAVFSSRGPNTIASDILKPDISAPGVDILAAYSPKGHVSELAEDTRSVTYNVLSGTSMSCPHVAGAAAYVKSLHPDWSPAAIKSALMTTADQMSPLKNKDAEFAYGSGHLNLNNATNPGLVYNATDDNYIKFLCNLGYDQKKIGLITGNTSVSCTNNTNDSSPKDVNYPSMSAMVDPEKPFTVKFRRTVMNVGQSNSTYKVTVTQGLKIKVQVIPDLLSFKSFQEMKSFDVVVTGDGFWPRTQDSASIIWYDGVSSVRSPIVVYSTI
ncbi:hypothetical protein RND81_05G263600 [Saponaria officinalis]|uniref:Uncharacterized protein n=1 Tax=Saponaria officinalis TaxID=3572 RepID=A0AAW1L3W1_SAPOF